MRAASSPLHGTARMTKLTGATLMALSLMPGALAHAAPGAEAPKPAGAPMGASAGQPAAKPAPEMFMAIGAGDAAGVKALLAGGVSANTRNTLGMTALMIAAGTGNMEIVKILVEAGAEINADSMFGTPLTFATLMGTPEGASVTARYLMEKGATVSSKRPDRMTLLMVAARNGDPTLVKMMLARKADVNALDNNHSTALSYAARHGSLAAARVLLDAGAKVDVADAEGWTPLIHAAVNGHTDVIRLLTARKASVNAMDKQGRTALVVAASYGDHPAAIKALLAAGAQANAKDQKGRTALMLAQARGYAGTARLLRERGFKTVAHWMPAVRTPRQAAGSALKAIEAGMTVFTKRTGCVSCHHEGMARWSTGVAAANGFKINTPLAQEQAKRVMAQLSELKPLHEAALANPAKIKDVPIVDVGDTPPTYGAVLLGLKEHGIANNPAVGASAAFLGRVQMPDGSWIFGMHRGPLQSGFFNTTAMAIRSLKEYEPEGQPVEQEARIARAKDWLLKTPAMTHDDKVFRLLGLHWAGASAGEKQKAIEELRATQRPDGGWAQEPGLASDAFATGSATYALRVAGELPAADPSVRRGVRFLLRTQEDDGTWYVYKRAMPANNYFNAGFPYGQNQYISFAATCWGLMALCAAEERPAPQITRSAPARPLAAR